MFGYSPCFLLEGSFTFNNPVSAQQRLIRLGRCPGLSQSLLGAHTILLVLHAAAQLSRVVRQPVFGVSDHVQHKPGCAATGDRLEISDLGSRRIALSM